MSNRFSKFMESDGNLGGWRAFHLKRPNGYLRSDINSIKENLQARGFSDLSPLVTAENNPVLHGHVENASDMLGLLQPARFHMAAFKSGKNSTDANFTLTTEKVPYVFVSEEYLKLAEFSPTYRLLILHLAGHEIQHGNQPDLQDIMAFSFTGDRPKEAKKPLDRAIFYLESTTSLTSPTMAANFLNLVKEAQDKGSYRRGRDGDSNYHKRISDVIEYDADMAIARCNGDFRGAMQEMVFPRIYNIQKRHAVSPNATLDIFNQEADFPNSSHPSDYERMVRLGQEELKAGAVPIGESPVVTKEEAQTWAGQYIAKIFDEASKAAKQNLR